MQLYCLPGEYSLPSRPKFASKLLKDRADWERLTVADPGERPAPPLFLDQT